MKYKATNSTIKPIKLNQKGQDIRSMRERVGYGVEFVIGEIPNDKRVTVQPGKSIILDALSEGILKLYRKGEVTITEVKDIGDELKNFAFKKEEKPVQEPVTPVADTVAVSPYEKVIPADIHAKAVPSGDGTVEDKMVNPDGEPNFIAKAPRGGLKKKRDTGYTDGEPSL